LSKILPSSGFAQGQVARAKMAKNLRHYDVTHKIPETQNQKIFFITDSRLAKSFEGFNSSLAQSPGKLCSCLDTFQTKASANCPGSEGVK